jgi:hypothetical protein
MSGAPLSGRKIDRPEAPVSSRTTRLRSDRRVLRLCFPLLTVDDLEASA